MAKKKEDKDEKKENYTQGVRRGVKKTKKVQESSS
jgi:hypothetical protein